MNKSRNNQLIKLADEALRSTNALFKADDNRDIDEAYNGHVAALGVSIAMSGLRPALAIYYQDSKTKVRRRAILTVIAKMIQTDENRNIEGSNDNNFNDAQSLFKYALTIPENHLKNLAREVVDCSIALKQVVRTYNLV